MGLFKDFLVKHLSEDFPSMIISTAGDIILIRRGLNARSIQPLESTYMKFFKKFPNTHISLEMCGSHKNMTIPVVHDWQTNEEYQRELIILLYEFGFELGEKLYFNYLITR